MTEQQMEEDTERSRGSAHASGTGDRRGKKRGGWRSAVKEIGIILIGALLISFVLRTFVIQTFEIPSESMQQTLELRDHIFVSKVVDFKRGDIVVFEDFSHWVGKAPEDPGALRRGLELVGVLPDSSRNYVVKRVIGTAGDKVKCCDTQGRISVNGHALQESEYLYRESVGTVKPSDFQFEVVVPKDRLFVMGDHRNLSADSRCHFMLGIDTFVPVAKVVGPVVAIATPLDRMRRFVTPDTFRDVPAASGDAPTTPVLLPADAHC